MNPVNKKVGLSSQMICVSRIEWSSVNSFVVVFSFILRSSKEINLKKNFLWKRIKVMRCFGLIVFFHTTYTLRSEFHKLYERICLNLKKKTQWKKGQLFK